MILTWLEDQCYEVQNGRTSGCNECSKYSTSLTCFHLDVTTGTAASGQRCEGAELRKNDQEACY